uniref:Putative secreted protein n=1 Tax=Anopheles triannulatus TaxID=58253 RepID=A0A2M4B4Z9_9DIPT
MFFLISFVLHQCVYCTFVAERGNKKVNGNETRYAATRVATSRRAIFGRKIGRSGTRMMLRECSFILPTTLYTLRFTRTQQHRAHSPIVLSLRCQLPRDCHKATAPWRARYDNRLRPRATGGLIRGEAERHGNRFSGWFEHQIPTEIPPRTERAHDRETVFCLFAENAIRLCAARMT